MPPMPLDLQDHRDRIVNAMVLVDVTFMSKLWDELECCLDVGPVTRAAVLSTYKET
jgi:hypothetical protein